MSPQLILTLLFFLFLLALFLLWPILSRKNSTSSFLNNQLPELASDKLVLERSVSFVNISLPLFFKEDLWWAELTVNDQKFPVIIDTGSSWLTLPNVTCTKCQGPNYLNESITSTSALTYGGGQEINYQLRPLYVEEFGRVVNVSVIANGTNGQDSVKSVLGLLNSSLGLDSVILDFPGKQLILNPDLSAQTRGTPIETQRFISVKIPTYQGVNSVVLDSGTNFILSPITFTNGFNFEAGSQIIYVPNSIIRNYEINPLSNTVILGNKAMSQYRWEIDFRRKMVWAKSS